MQLIVTARSSTQNLVDLATVRRRLLGSSSDASQDEELKQLIVEASSAMAGYLGRPFARQTYQLSFRGDGRSSTILLPYYPIDRDSITGTINGTAVTDTVVLDEVIGKVYRFQRWSCPSDPTAVPLNVVLGWKGGYVLPDQVKTWAATLTGLVVGDWVRPTSPAKSPLLFEVTTPGSAGGSEPTWPTATGVTVALGGGAVATARDASELDPLISSLAFVEVFNRHAMRTRAPGLAGMSGDGVSEQYFATHTESDLAPTVRAGLDRLRAMVA